MRAGLKRGFTAPPAITLEAHEATLVAVADGKTRHARTPDSEKPPFRPRTAPYAPHDRAGDAGGPSRRGARGDHGAIVPAYATTADVLPHRISAKGARTPLSAESMPNGKAYYQIAHPRVHDAGDEPRRGFTRSGSRRSADIPAQMMDIVRGDEVRRRPAGILTFLPHPIRASTPRRPTNCCARRRSCFPSSTRWWCTTLFRPPSPPALHRDHRSAARPRALLHPSGGVAGREAISSAPTTCRLATALFVARAEAAAQIRRRGTHARSRCRWPPRTSASRTSGAEVYSSAYGEGWALPMPRSSSWGR